MIKALHQEWLTAKRESQGATDAEAALTKRTEALHTSVMAAQTLFSQQDLDGLLHHPLEIAKESTGAYYAALGISSDNQREPGQFLSSGIDDVAAQAIQALSLEQSARESLGQEDGALSLSHRTKHWASLGLHEDHAPMTSFLGVSI